MQTEWPTCVIFQVNWRDPRALFPVFWFMLLTFSEQQIISIPNPLSMFKNLLEKLLQAALTLKKKKLAAFDNMQLKQHLAVRGLYRSVTVWLVEWKWHLPHPAEGQRISVLLHLSSMAACLLHGYGREVLVPPACRTGLFTPIRRLGPRLSWFCQAWCRKHLVYSCFNEYIHALFVCNQRRSCWWRWVWKIFICKSAMTFFRFSFSLSPKALFIVQAFLGPWKIIWQQFEIISNMI